MSFNQHNELQPTNTQFQNWNSSHFFRMTFFEPIESSELISLQLQKNGATFLPHFFWGGVPGTWDPNLPPELGPRKNSVKKEKNAVLPEESQKRRGTFHRIFAASSDPFRKGLFSGKFLGIFKPLRIEVQAFEARKNRESKPKKKTMHGFPCQKPNSVAPPHYGWFHPFHWRPPGRTASSRCVFPIASM